MLIFFSATLGSFGDEDSHGARMIQRCLTPEQEAAGDHPDLIENQSCRIPADAVFVTAEQRDQLLIAQGQGKILSVVGGDVVALDAQPPRPDEQLLLVREQRNRMLRGTDYIVAVPDFAISPERLTELRAWRAALRDVPDQLDPAAPFETVTWPPRPVWLSDGFSILISDTA